MHYVSARLALLALVTLISDAQAQQRDAITIRAPQALSTRVQDLLVQLGATSTITVAAGQDPVESIRIHCGGSYTNDYASHLTKLNEPSLFRVAEATRTLTLPPCVRVAKNVNFEVLQGDDVESISQRTFGVPSTRTIQVCDPKGGKPAVFTSCTLSAGAALAAMNGGKPLNPATLIAGRVLTAPTVALPTTFALKAGVAADTAVSLLKAAVAASSEAASSAIVVDPLAGYKLIQPLKSDSALIIGTPCDVTAESNLAWPINLDAITAKLQATRQIAITKGIFLGPSIIRIADTGFLGISSFFPAEALVQNKLDQADQPFDIDRNRYIADRYGFDAESKGDISPYSDDPYRLHGTQVADVALGGTALRTKYSAVYDLVKVSFAKISWKLPGAIIVRDEALIQAMKPVENHLDPHVVNVSVGAGNENGTRLFEDILRLQPLKLLVVIAAGNDNNDIGTVPMYPASFGGSGSDFSSWILTVGASSPDNKMAPFSNHGRSRVDLLAPGCRIPFAMDEKEREYLHGTSVAAPLVSFVAAALRSLGISKMQEVKLRIIASADFDHALVDKTRFGGVILNAERALSLFDDVIRLKGGAADILGTWQRPEDGIQLCRNGEVLNPRRILAVSSYVEQGELRLRLLHTEIDGRMADPTDCAAAESTVDFIANDGTKHKIAINEINTLVPAYPYPKQ